MPDKFDTYIDQYKQYLEEDKLDPMTFKDEESKQAFNLDIATATFGGEQISKLIEKQVGWYPFTGDWWHFAFLDWLTELDETEKIKNINSWCILVGRTAVGSKLVVHLEKALFNQSNLSEVTFSNTYLRKACFDGCNLKEAHFHECQIRDTSFCDCNLCDSEFFDCNLKNASIIDSILSNSEIVNSNFEVVHFLSCELLGTSFNTVRINEDTDFDRCEFDSICRSLYFSVVTMTTLGFGHIYARPDSFLGYAFLTTQVILGYVLLGVLISRLAVLFNTDGPTYRTPESPNHPKFWPQFWTDIKFRFSFVKVCCNWLFKKEPQIETIEH